MSERTRSRSLDLWIRGVGTALTLTTIILGVWRFNVGERGRAEFTFRSTLWLQKLEACRTLGDLTGRVTAYADDPRFPEMVLDFRAAYWGPMILVEDKPTEKAMINFNLSIEDFQHKRIDAVRLKQRAAQLLLACRCSFERSPLIVEEPAALPATDSCEAHPGD
jgi:hypothetical protein